MATAAWESRINSAPGGSYGQHYTIRLEAAEGTYNVANNQTPVTVTLKVKADSGYGYYGYTTYGTITIDGTTYGQQSIGSNVGTNWVTIASNTKTVTHNADGSKSINVSAVFDTSYGNLVGTGISGTFTLTKHARYFTTTPTLTYVSATETAMNFSWATSENCSKAILYRNGTAVQTKSSLDATSGSFDAVTGLTANTSYQWYVKCTRKDSGLDSDSEIQDKATYDYPSITNIGTSEITIPAPGGTVSQSLTLYNPLSRSVSVSAKIGSTTIVNSAASTTGTSATLSLVANSMYTGIGSTGTNGTITYSCVYESASTKTATGTCKTSSSNCGPTVSANPTYQNTSGTTHTDLVGTDTIIQGKSSFKVTSPTITTRGGATVAKYYFKIGSGNYESTGTTAYKTYTSTSLSGSVVAYCYAEDSRGYISTVKQVTMRVLPYTAPIATITASRTGYTTNGSITVQATRVSLSKSSAPNTDTNKWVGNTSSNKISLSISPDSGTLAATVIGGTETSSTGTVSISTLDLDTTYTITVNISDKISTITKTVTISKAKPIISILNTNKVGINKPDPSYTFDVDGTSNISGNTTIGGDATISGTASITGNTTISGTATISKTLTAGASTSANKIHGTLEVTKSISAGTTISATGDISSSGSMTIGSNSEYYVGPQTLKSVITNIIYPVGSIYISVSDNTAQKVQNRFGGTWEAFGTGKTLVGIDANDTDFDTVEETGGEKTHTLIESEMPSHKHFTSNYNGGGNVTGMATTNASPHGSQDYWNFNNPGNSSYTGGNQPHNNLQPYVVVYMWKRTA